ncbi:MAG TPA: hypothetical protein VHZ98_15980 [Galbitalea sp.]|nr:hypothetical protein [Galbitalea sp.]
MPSELELISDGDGIAIFGDPAAIERFLASEGLQSRELGLQRLGSKLGAASGMAQAGSEVAANSGRWVKLTEQSAAALKQSTLMKGSSPGVSRAVLTENGGKVKGILEIVKTPGSILTNPAMLAGAAGIMAQLAMQQTMDEILDYLAVIDAKVDDVLRAQKNAVLADMIGVDSVLDEAMIVREHVGRVSEVTWSKVQGTALTIAKTQAYALLQLDAIAEKLEKQTKVGNLADASREAEAKVVDWLAVLAHCFRLQDGLAVLELDRVLDASPEELDRHRMALHAARQKRLEFITKSTRVLLTRIDAAAGTANENVLLHPMKASAVVRASSHAADDVLKFHVRLGIEDEQHSLEARRWRDAAVETRDKAIKTGANGVGSVARLGSETFERATSAATKFAGDVVQHLPLRRSSSTDTGADEGE